MKKLLIFTVVLFISSLLCAQATYEVGKIYEINGVKGLVYKVTANGRHGMMMSLQTCPKKESVASSNHDLWDTIAGLCKDAENGMNNFKAVETYIKENNLKWDVFPIFAWAHNLGDGWYIPSREEMKEMVSSIYGVEFVGNIMTGKDKTVKDINDALKDNDGDKINFPMVGSTCTKSTNKKGKSFYSRTGLLILTSDIGGIIGIAQDATIDKVAVSEFPFKTAVSGVRAIRSF